MSEGRVRLWLNTWTSPEAVGKGYGYRVHEVETRRYLSLDPGVELTPEAQDWITICAAECFERQEPPKHEGIFTMFEGQPLPPMYRRQLVKADFVLTPTTWVEELFKKHVPDLPPCYVVPHGVSPEFSFCERSFPRGRPFRFMWCGSTDDRKNWRGAIDAWQKSRFFQDPRFELYIKTSAIKGKILPKHPKHNIIVDNRSVAREVLTKLYHRAHAFLFPTMGEGFGLTLAEAMRTGLPCIATGYSGHMDFFDEGVGYPVGWEWGRGTATFIGGREHSRIYLAIPQPEEMAQAMERLVEEYAVALEKGRCASERITKEFTWQRAVRRIVEVIQTEQQRREAA